MKTSLRMMTVAVASLFAVSTFAGVPRTESEMRDVIRKLRDKASDEQPSTWGDIKSWRDMGGRWAGALNQDGKLIAVYDLSYPLLFGTIPMATIGGDVDLRPLAAQFEKAAMTGLAADDSLARDAAEAVRDLGRKAVIANPFADGWWKKMPWKNRGFAALQSEPASFTLEDFDFTGSKELMGLISDIAANVIDDTGVPLFGENFLSRVQFVRTQPGQFVMNWTPPKWLEPRAKMVLDFESKYSGLLSNLQWNLVKELLSAAIGTFNVPLASALVGTAVNRVFHYHSLMQKSHQEMAMEMVNSAHEGSLSSKGFPELTVAQREQAGEYLKLSESDLYSAWEWIFKSPLDTWKKDMADELATSAQSIEFLTAAGNDVNPLNHRFGLAIPKAKGDAKQMYVLASQVLGNRIGPDLAVNYADIQKLHDYRVGFEVGTVAVVFASYFIPAAGGLIRDAYSYFVESAMNKTKTWEARLMSHLEERSTRFRQNWELEISTLADQRINPFEFTVAESKAAVLEWRQRLKMPLQ